MTEASTMAAMSFSSPPQFGQCSRSSAKTRSSSLAQLSRTARRCAQFASHAAGCAAGVIEYLADKVGRERFWPKEDAARAMARSMVAEMHSGYAALRRQCPMNIRRRVEGAELSPEARADVVRILTLWAEARARFGKGGPFLFGSFCAADIIYAPVVSRFITYAVVVPGFAVNYMQAVWEHEWLQIWIEAAEAEDWVIEQWEVPAVK